MEALERFYQEYLMDYVQDSNSDGYDVDAQLTRNRIEQILESGYIREEDVEFIKSILPEIENESIQSDIQEYLENFLL